MAERKYYVRCDSNCKFESLTKEQIYAAIAEATGNTPTGVDDAFITKVVEQNKSTAMRMWVGTQTEYNAIVASGDTDTETIYFIKDDTTPVIKTCAGIERPPMELGVPYLTSELYEGLPVYICRFSLVMPEGTEGGGSKKTKIPVDLYGAKIIEQNAVLKNSSTDPRTSVQWALPCFYDNELMMGAYVMQHSGANASVVYIYARPNQDFSAYTGEMTIKYVPNYYA